MITGQHTHGHAGMPLFVPFISTFVSFIRMTPLQCQQQTGFVSRAQATFWSQPRFLVGAPFRRVLCHRSLKEGQPSGRHPVEAVRPGDGSENCWASKSTSLNNDKHKKSPTFHWLKVVTRFENDSIKKHPSEDEALDSLIANPSPAGSAILQVFLWLPPSGMLAKHMMELYTNCAGRMVGEGQGAPKEHWWPSSMGPSMGLNRYRDHGYNSPSNIAMTVETSHGNPHPFDCGSTAFWTWRFRLTLGNFMRVPAWYSPGISTTCRQHAATSCWNLLESYGWWHFKAQKISAKSLQKFKCIAVGSVNHWSMGFTTSCNFM